MPEPEPRRRVPWGALVVGLVILAYWIIASRADEPGAVTPTARDTVAQSGIGSHQMTLGPGIYLLALGRLETIDLPKLSGELSLRYHLPIEILPPLPVTTSTLDSADHALDADRLLDLIAQSFHVKARTTIIGLTDYELYSASIGGRYPFSLRAPPHYAVVSTADLGVDDFVQRLQGYSRHERTRKLVARDIGFLYLGLPEVQDPRSLLRPEMSDITEIDDLRESLG